MAKNINLNLQSPLEMVYRKSVALKSGATIQNGQWFVLDNGEAALAGSDGSATPVAYLAFNDSAQSDVKATLPSGATVSTGGMTGLVGVVEGTVNTNGYKSDGTYAVGKELTVENGKLVDAVSGDWIFAVQTVAIGADALLHFVGNSGLPLYKKA
ncbi:MAG: hypothetical protein ABFE07_29155 [Armatimonadia bacterium]